MASDNPTRGTRFPDGMEDEFTDYRDEKDMNNAEALRELVRTGLSEKRADPLDDRPDGLVAGLLWDARRDIQMYFAVMLLATILTVVSTGLLSYISAAVALLYLLTVTVGVIDALLLDKRLTLPSAEGAQQQPAEVEA